MSEGGLRKKIWARHPRGQGQRNHENLIFSVQCEAKGENAISRFSSLVSGTSWTTPRRVHPVTSCIRWTVMASSRMSRCPTITANTSGRHAETSKRLDGSKEDDIPHPEFGRERPELHAGDRTWCVRAGEAPPDYGGKWAPKSRVDLFRGFPMGQSPVALCYGNSVR